MEYQVLLSTTGTVSSVQFDDLGGREFSHPTADFNLLDEFFMDEIQNSSDLQSALTNGYITITYNSVNITDLSSDLQPIRGSVFDSHTHTESDITDLDHDAQKIKGISVDSTNIGDGRILVYKSSSGKLEYDDQSGSGTSLEVQKDDSQIDSAVEILNFEEIDVTDEGSHKLTISPIFGSHFQQTSDELESSTTSSSWQNKLTLTTSNLPSGTYRIGWYHELRQSTTWDAVEARVQLNDTTDLQNVEHEPKDKNDIFSCGGFVYKVLSGVNTIDIDYRQQRGSTAYISKARLEIWRIS